MSRTEFNKYIKSLEEEELRKELTAIYQKIPEVKLHYAMELGSDADRMKIFRNAKKDINNLIYIRNRPRKRPRIQKIKTILKDISKISVFEHEMAELYLFASECQMQYLLRRPSTTKATYNNCIENFKKACDIIDQLALQAQFKDRCQMLATDSDSLFMIEEELEEIYNKTFRS